MIENDSDKAVIVQSRDMSVNGIMMDGMFSANVDAGKKANDGITILKSKLEENDIKDNSEIKEVEFKLFVADKADIMSNKTSDSIKLEF